MALSSGRGSPRVLANAARVEEEQQARRLRLGIDPTPEQIRAKCEEIQARWSPYERKRRAGLPYKRVFYTIPEVELFTPEQEADHHYRHLDY